MEQKKIKAVFQGANGSLGYETDKEYTLLLRVEGSKIVIQEIHGKAMICKYNNILLFIENWDCIRRISN